MKMIITEWLLCPICKSKTRIKLRENTELKRGIHYYRNE